MQLRTVFMHPAGVVSFSLPKLAVGNRENCRLAFDKLLIYQSFLLAAKHPLFLQKRM
jgi:hypothetical protein